MTMPRLLFAFVLLMSPCAADESALPSCRFMSDAQIPKYHTDDRCDRVAHNSLEKRKLREGRHLDLMKTGVAHIPDQLTVACPEEPTHLQPAFGHDTKWIVENKSSGPAVVCFVMDGVEYSAYDPTITPPQADPNAVLLPGDFMAVDCYEGHVFYVREVLEDGSTGRILVQHRPGLIGFTNRYNQDLDCEYYEDVEPIVEVHPPRQTIIKTDPEYERTPEHKRERCHIVYQGFRNTLPNCPLHVYYVGNQEPSVGPMQCKEDFKFHLGLSDDTPNYMHDWDSRTKFEATYIGHAFTARLASNPDIVVDTFRLQPTEIHDCPRLKQKPIAEQQVIKPNGVQQGIHQHTNFTSVNDDPINVTSRVVGMSAGSSK